MKTVTIGTFNIQHGRDHAKYLETKTETIDLPLMASVIRDEVLDICALNEVRNDVAIGRYDQAKAIGEALSYHWRFVKAIDSMGGEYGNAIVSRFPILSVKTYPLSVPKDARTKGHYYEDRVLYAAELDVDGEILTVLGCHFGLAPDEATLAAETAARVLGETDHPVVLLGDFNVVPESPVYAMLTEHFTDAADDRDPYFTFPSHAPSRKIDYVFTANGAEATAFTVCPEVASDHRAVKATVTF